MHFLGDMKIRGIVLLGAMVGCLVAGFWWFPRSTPAADRTKSGENDDGSRSVAASGPSEPPVRRSRERSDAPVRDGGLSRHDAGKWINFILPHVEGNDVTAHQALAILKEAYLDACFRSREKPLELGFSIEAAPEVRVSFSLEGRSLVECVNHIAALAGLEVRRVGTTFELARGEAADQIAELSVRKDPSTMPRLLKLAGRQDTVGDGDWEGLLRTSGFILESGTSLTEDAGGHLVVKGSNAEIARVRSALKLAAQHGRQIKLTTRLISTDAPVDLAKPNLTPDEWQALMRELASRKGTELTTEPSVTAREGEHANMEIIREKIEGDRIVGWTGLKHGMTATRAGLKIVGSDKSEKRPEVDDGSGWLSENDFALHPGETDVRLVSSGNGIYRYRLLTVTPIDAAGRPLDGSDKPQDPGQTSTGNPMANAVTGKSGFVFSPYNNKIVDVRGVPSGTLVMDPSYPASEKKVFRVP